MTFRIALLLGAAFSAVLLICLAAALTFGGPNPPKPMQSISDPFKGVDFSALPPLGHYAARDGAQLAYRSYPPVDDHAPRGSVVLVHGSSANSESMHPLAQTFAQAGFAIYALDLRGHGYSGPHGDIAYIGQLDDDLEDFLQAVKPARPRTLLGFSAGGGFAIRFAGGTRQALFDKYLFLAPYTSNRAPNFRPGGGGWVSVGVPRLIALTLLNRIGVTGLNHLPVIDFAVNENIPNRAPEAQLTRWYSYTLSRNMQPIEDYQRNIRDIREPAAALDGQDDEVFIAQKLAQLFAEAGRSDIPVTLVSDTGHIALTLNPAARAAALHAVEQLDVGAAAAAPDVRGPHS